MKQPVDISTDLVEPGHRTDLWRAVNEPLFDAAPWRDQGDPVIEGSVSMRQAGVLITAAITFNRQQLVRDRAVILRSGLDHYVLQVITAGSLAGNFGGVDVVARPGDILIIDLAQPLQNRIEAGARITVLAPRQPLDQALGGRNLHGVVLQKDWPITSLLRSYLQGLHAVCLDMSDAEADAAHDAMLRLLAAGLTRGDIDAATDHSALGRVLRRRILAFIDAHIHDQQLSPELIMKRFNVSRSHLYRTFAGDGGVAKLLRDRRLDAAFRELTHPGAPTVLISDLAYRLGFSSGNQLLRAFRARFGATPSQVRAERAGDGPRAEGADALRRYYETLRERAIGG